MPSYPQQSGWDEPRYGSPEPARTNGFAVTALVLGLLACLFFWTVVGGLLLGLLAAVFGILAVLRTRGGRAPRRVMAIVGASLGVLGLLGSALVLVVGLSVLDSESYSGFEDCMRDAGSRSAEDRCAEDFADSLTG
ncbi:DUF4190 domain-containing protein [Streptomyces sp. ADI96-02]|uniref:DUF4190 domain-containing protein n=2 Tax=unclassified Streptomyces TaxID=2593676 RepID=UPI001F151E05|nr:DUF4190 domain-containing protein [Streptomyces sp. ADI96-02]